MSLVILSDTKGNLIEAHQLRLEMPLLGTWTAHLETTADTAIDGNVVITIQHGDEAAERFVGTVVDGEPYEGRAPLVVVGGTEGLSKRPAKASYYVGANSAIEVAQLVGDVLVEADEVPSDATALSGLRASAWARLETESHARALTRIAERFDIGWRVFASGAVWAGPVEWLDADLEGEELDVDTDARIVSIRYRVASARPGTTIGGRRISLVVFTADGLGELHYEAM
ncbi:MAG: hypothetical protein ABJE95_19605 [Byssovorax sp.]